VIESVVRGRGRLSEEVIRFHESRHMGLEGLKRQIVSLASSDGNSRDSDVIKQLDSLLMFQTDAVAQKWWKRSAQRVGGALRQGESSSDIQVPGSP